MDNDFCDVYERFRNFPPLYTEQINDVVLSKQLEVWEFFIRSLSAKQSLFFINVDDSNIVPFNNIKINRMLKREFMTLIAQHLVERGYGYYHHVITSYCRNNECSVWGALFIGGKTRATQLANLHSQEYARVASRVKPSDNSVTLLKAKRDCLANNPVIVGIYAKTIDETVNDVFLYLKGQLSGTQVETPYYLFWGERESTIPFRSWPEVHVALVISILVMHRKIVAISNDTVALKTLNSKQLGIQLS
ncbi:hypothetical protein X943_002031 [Babesia divergens]|uniref:Uncharacterized protein n=1 Tax=Babesia divergens TaxID=32595 RepID=A0AAD9LH18_BABDI|nr:hypothetical protein X943_002031 [Babesia divergens]